MNKEVKEKKVPFLRRPFTKLIFGKVREFENRAEYKKFYYENRNKKIKFNSSYGDCKTEETPDTHDLKRP